MSTNQKIPLFTILKDNLLYGKVSAKPRMVYASVQISGGIDILPRLKRVGVCQREVLHKLTLASDAPYWDVYRGETLTCEEQGPMIKGEMIEK